MSSISLESDFVSPENVSQSFFMYRQIRHVSESQRQPIVDKLSVKNLIFHSVKNAVATLESIKEDEENNHHAKITIKNGNSDNGCNKAEAPATTANLDNSDNSDK